MKPDRCTGNFILKDILKMAVEDKFKKFNLILRESIVEAVKIRVYILEDFSNIICVLF